LLLCIAASRNVYSAEVSPEFNVLSLMRPGELTLSRMLAWLLDETENHCQGSKFLEAFLTKVQIPIKGVASAIVKLEEVVDFGRLDISLRLADGRLIVIENKPRAADQPMQIERYLQHVGDRGHVIYLPGTLKEAAQVTVTSSVRERSLAERSLIESSWVDLISFFEDCATISRSPRVRAFLEEIPRYIRAEFQGVPDMTEANTVVDEMVLISETIEAAFLVSTSIPIMQERLIKKLVHDVNAQLPSS
jgi:hypothetical protein